MAIKEPFIFFPYNYCFNCKTNSIELYSWMNYGLGYANMLKELSLGKIPEKLNKYACYTMRCKHCGRVYPIYWTSDGFPRPVLNNFHVDQFITKFKLDFLETRPERISSSYKEIEL